MDGRFSSWYRFNFLGTVFFCSCLVSATSSYADDIAHIKILDDQKQMLGVSTDGVSVPLSFLMVVLTSCWFDWDFLVNGFCYLRCKRGISIYRWCFGFLFLFLFSGVRVFCKISAL